MKSLLPLLFGTVDIGCRIGSADCVELISLTSFAGIFWRKLPYMFLWSDSSSQPQGASAIAKITACLRGGGLSNQN